MGRLEAFCTWFLYLLEVGNSYFLIKLFFHRTWLVFNGIDGLVCNNGKIYNDGRLECDEIIVPDCVDKTVICTDPPKFIEGATISILEDPSDFVNSGKKRFRFLSIWKKKY